MLAVIALFGASCGEQAGKILRDAETDAPALTAERVRQLLNVRD